MSESREEKLKRLSEKMLINREEKISKKENDGIVVKGRNLLNNLEDLESFGKIEFENKEDTIIDKDTRSMLDEIMEMLDAQGISYSEEDFIEKIEEMKELNLDKIDISVGNDDDNYKIRIINMNMFDNDKNDFLRMDSSERERVINDPDEMFKYSDHRMSSKINDTLRMINSENMHVIYKNGFKSSQSVQNILLMAPYNIDFMEFVSNDDDEFLYNNFPLLFLMYFSSDRAIEETLKLEEILDSLYNEGFDNDDTVIHDTVYDFSYARFLKLKEDSKLSDISIWKDYTLLDNNVMAFHNYVTNVLYLNLLVLPTHNKDQFFESYFGKIFNFILDNDLYPTIEDFEKIVCLALDDDELYDFTSNLVYCGFVKQPNYFKNVLILINMITLRYYHKYLTINNIESDGAN